MSGTPAPVAQSVTSPFRQTQGKVVPVSVLKLNDIPHAMDKMGWTVAAQLMRHWFSIKPAWAMPERVKQGKSYPLDLLPSQVNDRIVKLDWVLSFPRAAEALKELLSQWNTPKGRDELKEKLRHAKWDASQGRQASIGYGLQEAIQADALAQVNFKSVGTKVDTLDGLFGALGKFTLKLAVAGQTQASGQGGKSEFHVERVGYYVRDTYDFQPTAFEKEVPLGVWSRDKCLDKLDTLEYMSSTPRHRAHLYPGFVPVYNTDFCRWQQQNNEGGDFVVYSDIRWETVSIPPIPLD